MEKPEKKVKFADGIFEIPIVKFYDWAFAISIISLISVYVVVWLPSPFDNLAFVFLLISIISELTFHFGILYWMFKSKNYILFLFGIFIFLIPILYYFFSLREKFKKLNKS